MASPRFIGIRDVIDPYRGLQDSVSKVGDIYRQYDKDAQEAQRIRNEEARLSERLAMDRATHKQQQDKYAEEQRRNEVIRGFDPEKQIENYGIPERFIPEISKPEQQVRDYYSRAPLIAAGNGAEGTQARQQVEESFPALRAQARSEAFDAATAQRQGLDYLISQGVPASEAVSIVQARTLGQLSHTDKHAAMVAQAKTEDDYAQEVAKLQKDILVAQIRNNKPSTSGSTTSGKTGSSTNVIKENFDDFGIKPEDQKKATENFKAIIGDGFNSEGFFGWTGNATNAVNSIVASVTEINNDIAVHNKNVTLENTKGELRKYIDFNDAVKWVGGTAKKGSNIKLSSPGELKVFIEDTAKRRDFSEAANKARELEAKKKAGGLLTGADIEASMPQRTVVPPIDDVIRSRVTASYAKMFPEVFPKPPSATTPIPRPSNTTADGEVDSKTDTKSAADGEPNIIGGTRSNVQAPQQQQQEQAISRDVLLPFDQETQTPVEADINSAVSRLSEIQERAADPDLSSAERRKLTLEARVIRDSLKQLPDNDRVFEAIRGNAKQTKDQSAQDQKQVQENQNKVESTIKDVLQLRERLDGNLSPEVRRINEGRLAQLEETYPNLAELTSNGGQVFDDYISKLESQIRHRSAPGRGWGSSKTLRKLQQELDEAKRLAGYQKKKHTPEERLSSIGDLPTTGAGTNTRLPAPAGLTNTNEGKMAPEGSLSTKEHNERYGPTGKTIIDFAMNLPERSETFDQNAMTQYLNARNGNGNGIPLPSPVGAEVPPRRPTKALKPDRGVIFDTNEGDPIKAVRNGRVKFVGHVRGAGTSIVVEHDDGTIATYSDHSDTPFTAVGDRVSAGQLLMNASGTHGRTLLTVYGKNRKNVNPLEWLKENVTNG